MEIHYYKADSLAEAFEMASRDPKKWSFPAMEVLAELAADAHENRLKSMRIGMGTIYSASGGQFNVFEDSKRGYGLGLVNLLGREAGVDDPTAAEILEFHRDRPEAELYAEQLLVFSEHVPDIVALDTGYEVLTQLGLLVRTDSIIQITVGVETTLRPQYRLPRR